MLLFIFCSNAFSQFEPHPEVDWFTIETEHFTVSYHIGAERTAQVTAKIAEEIYGPVTSLYNFEPKDKVAFIINDLSDIANGATDYYGGRIEIFASALDFEFRGTHNWLRNVITHEYTHMIQIQAALKFTKNIPAIYLQVITYEKERRPDVLYGYPNTIISYPISGVGVPAWFAEGTAQYQRQQLGFDYWDSHRDMILRTRVIDNDMLTWNEMGQFSSITSLKAESIYNSGFALTRYISMKYGEDKLKDITKSLGEFTVFSVDKAIEKHLNKDGNALYDEWKKYLQDDYKSRLEQVRASLLEGNIILDEGFANLMPEYSPDGKKMLYLSNKTSDFGKTALFIYDFKTKESKLVAVPVSSNYGWSPDGKKIIYAKRNSPPNIDENVLFDLYIYDVNKEEETRLSKELRAFSPKFSSDGKLICFVVSSDGTLNLYKADANVDKKIKLTDFKNGEQIYDPLFTPDGKFIIFDYSLEDYRSIAKIDLTTLEITFLFENEKYDHRNPFISDDGKKLYFSSDRTGIFNIFSYDFESKEILQLTNVTGGAFMPSVTGSVDGNNNKAFNLVYANYTSSGYKIAEIKGYLERKPSEFGSYSRPDELVKQYSNPENSLSLDNSKFDWKKIKGFNDKNIEYKKSKEYKSIFTQLSIFPLIRFDNYSKDGNILDAFKPGFYIYSDEIMNRFSIFGGFAINRRAERDIFLQFNYDNGMPVAGRWFAKKLNFSPKISLSGYNVSRKADALLYAGVDTLSVGVAYDLLSLELAAAFKLINYNHDFKVLYTLSKYASSIDGFVLPQSGIYVRGSSQDYFRANSIAFEYAYDRSIGNRNMDINPVGRKINVRYEYESSRINPELQVDDNGNVSTIYNDNKLHKVDATWREAIGLFNSKHTIALKLRTAVIFGKKVDSFYDFYAAGLPGMRGYPYFSLGGGR
ncbi:MAG: biopolymer transporter Tol, partial [Ignavibacteriae bacterium]|nr:biopolymer transporter Tol [Ignavibacteriota bacterium]